jgi:hypothetical protein
VPFLIIDLLNTLLAVLLAELSLFISYWNIPDCGQVAVVPETVEPAVHEYLIYAFVVSRVLVVGAVIVMPVVSQVLIAKVLVGANNIEKIAKATSIFSDM